MGCDFRVAWPRCRGRYFNPRTPVGCDVIGAVAAIIVTLFQSTHPSGVRLSFALGFIQPPNFNPRTPVGCDLREPARIEINSTFQSTHPSGVRRDESWPRKSGSYYFNPRTPVGCDLSGSRSRRGTVYFNPRTPVGCDRSMACTRSTWRNFNPRTPVGCDRRSKLAAELTNTISIHAPQWGATVEIRTAAMAHPISIHAPQWGATRWCPSRRRTGRNFNPRTPVGCDPVGYVLSHSMGIFQSTHPSGVRQPCALIHLTAISYFNPRTPVGCDQEGLPPQDRRGISIHAPQWGATRGHIGVANEHQ